MELKFIWVDEYRSIENTGFNLSHTGNHRFKFKDNHLFLEPNTRSALDFGNKVLSVTAIAGQNGAGKSSLCEVIAHTMATLVNGTFGYSIDFKGIVCIGDYIFYHSDILVINLEELEGEGYNLKGFTASPLEMMGHELREAFNSLGFIYYSNVIDWRSGIDELNLDNISTMRNILYSNSYGAHYPHYYFEYPAIPTNHSYKDKKGELQMFYIEESIRNVKYYLNFEDQIPFSPPDYFVLDVCYSHNNRWIDTDSLEYEDSRVLEEIQSEIFNRFHPGPLPRIQDEIDDKIEINEESRKNATKQLYRLNLVKARISHDSTDLPNSESIRNFVFANGEWMFENPTEVNQLLGLHAELIDFGSGRNNYNPLMERISHGNYHDWRYYVIQNTSINNEQNIRGILKTFLELETKLLRFENHKNARISDCFMFPRLSSGQNSYYSLFSRLYNSIISNKIGVDERNSFVLFIDEAEIGFHPNWKKKVLKWLLNFLNGEFHNYKYQIIITSHSPYLLSDLCNQNLLLLKRSERGKTEIVDYKSRRTFGANIYELLSDSFFMEDGFIGDFAKEVLETLVAYLKGNDSESQSWNEIRAKEMISQVADDLIRMRLEDLFNEKFDNSPESLVSEKERLENRLNQIRTRLRDDQNTAN